MTASPLARPPIASRRAVDDFFFPVGDMCGQVYFDIRKSGSAASAATIDTGVRTGPVYSIRDGRFAIRKTRLWRRSPLKIGRQKPSNSAISTSNADVIVVRGMDLCRDLIGQVTFTDHVWLLVARQACRPTAQRHMLDAALVAIAEHGLVPSVVAGRMTLAAAPEALQGAVAAGMLRLWVRHIGRGRIGGPPVLQDIVRAASGGSKNGVHRREALLELRAARRAIPGYGHPLHKTLDPRAHQAACRGQAASESRAVTSTLARAVENLVPQIIGKPLVMNVSAAIGAILLDAGFPLLAVKGVPLLARTASLVAHLLEEQERPDWLCACRHRRRRRSTTTECSRPTSFPARALSNTNGQSNVKPAAFYGHDPGAPGNSGGGTGDVHHRAVRGHDARGPGRRCHQDRESGGRSVSQLPGPAVLAALSGLQPQQAEHGL